MFEFGPYPSTAGPMSVAETRTIAGISAIPSSQSAASESPSPECSFAEITSSPAKAVNKAGRQNRKKQQAVTLLQRRTVTSRKRRIKAERDNSAKVRNRKPMEKRVMLYRVDSSSVEANEEVDGDNDVLC
jgi:hypothetical protein